MKKEIEINEWIESYLNGCLPAGEEELFRKRTEEDPEFAMEVKRHEVLHEFIEDGTYLHIKNELREIHLKKTHRLRNFRRMSGFGIVVLTVIAVLLFVNKKNSSLKDNPVNTPVKQSNDRSIEALPDRGMRNPARKTVAREQGPKNVKAIGTLEKSDSLNKMPDRSQHFPVAKQVDDSTMDTMAGKEYMEPSAKVGSVKSDKQSGKEMGINETKVPDCSNVQFSVELTENESCSNKATGSFRIQPETVSGGRPPYSFSLNNSRFYDTLEFASLYPGNYPLYIRDGDNCTGLAGVARIGMVDCTYQAVFAPLKGELWSIPYETGKDGSIRIISKSGALVYSAGITGDDIPVWNGETETGQQLPMGIYLFEITYTDGTSFAGTVTIVK